MPSEAPSRDPFIDVRVLTMRQLRELIPYTPQHIYRLEAAGKFPRRIRIGENRVGWRYAQVLQWLSERPTVPAYDAEDLA